MRKAFCSRSWCVPIPRTPTCSRSSRANAAGAARRAGLTAIPAIVRTMDDREVLEIAIIENVQRADLNAIEEAEAYKSLIDRFGRTQGIGCDASRQVRASMSPTRCRLLNLPDEVREHVREGRLTRWSRPRADEDAGSGPALR